MKGIVHFQHREPMPIGSGRLQRLLRETKVNSSQQLLGFIATAGEQGALESLNQTGGLQFQRLSALDHRQIGVIVRRHSPHLIRATEAGQFHLVAGIVGGQSDRRVA